MPNVKFIFVSRDWANLNRPAVSVYTYSVSAGESMFVVERAGSLPPLFATEYCVEKEFRTTNPSLRRIAISQSLAKSMDSRARLVSVTNTTGDDGLLVSIPGSSTSEGSAQLRCNGGLITLKLRRDTGSGEASPVESMCSKFVGNKVVSVTFTRTNAPTFENFLTSPVS